MASKKDGKRIVSKKNYVILLSIFLISGFIFWLLVEPFKKEEKQESKLTDKLEKVDYVSFGEFITERQNVIVYLTDFSEKSDLFEDEFEKVINDEELNLEVVYMNSNELTMDELENIRKLYYSDKLKSSNVELKVIPNLLLFQDGKVVDILYKIETESNKSEIVIFLENYGVVEND